MRISPNLRSVGLRAIALALALGGCAVVTSHDEYTAYRSVRLATDDRERLIAMQRYAERHPNGTWIAEVRDERATREDDVWARSNTTREGLEWYLRVYPDGAYVEQARPRLAALQTVSSRREEEANRQEELEEQRRAQQREAQRTWVTRAVQFWTRTLLGVRNYGSSIQRVAGANPDFNRAFGQEPAPQCSPDYCIKHYGQLYHIPVPGATRIDRQMDVFLRIKLVRGRVERAELLLPNKGFSRWYELENRTVITDEDPEQRMMAINWALERIQPIIEELAAGASRVDVVPEPIEPLQARSGGQTEQAPVAPDEAPAPTPPTPPAQTNQPAQPPAGTGNSEIDDLLNQATGGDPNAQEQALPPPQPQTTTPEPAGTIVLPVGLLGYQARNLRVVVFAAGEDDYEQGYDGLFIERFRE